MSSKSKNMKFIFVEPWNLMIGAPPKCGSTSIYYALRQEFGGNRTLGERFPMYYHPSVPRDIPLLFVVRHPLDRFKSLWRHRCIPGADSEWPVDHAWHGATPGEFWKGFRRDDKHARPQIEHLGTLEPAHLIRIESLADFWDNETPSKVLFKRRNVTEHLDTCKITHDLEAEILRYYPQDIELYEEAK